MRFIQLFLSAISLRHSSHGDQVDAVASGIFQSAKEDLATSSEWKECWKNCYVLVSLCFEQTVVKWVACLLNKEISPTWILETDKGSWWRTLHRRVFHIRVFKSSVLLCILYILFNDTCTIAVPGSLSWFSTFLLSNIPVLPSQSLLIFMFQQLHGWAAKERFPLWSGRLWPKWVPSTLTVSPSGSTRTYSVITSCSFDATSVITNNSCWLMLTHSPIPGALEWVGYEELQTMGKPCKRIQATYIT